MFPRTLAERVAEVEGRCPRYVEDVLGRPPRDESTLQRWREGVAVVEGFRARAGVVTEFDALGPEPDVHDDLWTTWQRASIDLMQAKVELIDQSPGDPVAHVDAGFDLGL